jgi:hypothetical protein
MIDEKLIEDIDRDLANSVPEKLYAEPSMSSGGRQ